LTFAALCALAPCAPFAALAQGMLEAKPEPLTVDHYVHVTSRVPTMQGQAAQLYVRERVTPTMRMLRTRSLQDRVVIFVHGAGTPAEVAFDAPGASWMAYLAQAGYDVFSMDMTGYGRSSLRLQGRPAEARQFLEQGVSRLPEVHDLRAFAEYQIEQCKVEQSAEEGLEAALAGSRVSEDAGEQVQFALLCMRRDRHAEALRFFGDAFRLDPAAAGDWASSRRYDAACTAAILAGVGSESAATDGAALLAQAYDSLEADLGEMEAARGSGRRQRRTRRDRLQAVALADRPRPRDRARLGAARAAVRGGAAASGRPVAAGRGRPGTDALPLIALRRVR
jgi:pimeloyl-ACP methyl ester carboxylesterase